MIMMAEVLLTVSVALIGIALIPQTMRSLNEGTRGISLYSYCITAFGMLSFSVYGFYVQSLFIAISSAIGLSLASVIIACKMRNKD